MDREEIRCSVEQGLHRQRATRTRSTRSTPTTSSATILNRASGSGDAATCRPCAAIIRVIRRIGVLPCVADVRVEIDRDQHALLVVENRPPRGVSRR
jgi:hypothetical protein